MLQKLQPPQIFSGASSGRALTTPKAQIENCSPDDALRYAALLLGCYSKSDCADPEVFATACVSVLSRFPEDVVRKVVDPLTGLPGTLKWFPKLPEIREACETLNNAAKRRQEQDARIAEQMAERDRMAAMNPVDRRREFIRGEMAKINAVFAAKTEGAAPTLDLRGMEECAEKDALRRRLDAEISAFSAQSAARSLRLSELCLSTRAGQPPLSSHAEAAQ